MKTTEISLVNWEQEANSLYKGFSVQETFVSNEKIILTPSGIRAKGPIIYSHFYIAFTKVKNKKQKTKQNHM